MHYFNNHIAKSYIIAILIIPKREFKNYDSLLGKNDTSDSERGRSKVILRFINGKDQINSNEKNLQEDSDSQSNIKEI